MFWCQLTSSCTVWPLVSQFIGTYFNTWFPHHSALGYSEFDYVSPSLSFYLCVFMLVDNLLLWLKELPLTCLIKHFLVMDSLSFCLSGKIFTSPSFPKYNFTELNSLFSYFYFFQGSEYIILLCHSGKVFAENSAGRLIEVPFNLFTFFLFLLSKFFSSLWYLRVWL
jgi:hypothetical protein